MKTYLLALIAFVTIGGALFLYQTYESDPGLDSLPVVTSGVTDNITATTTSTTTVVTADIKITSPLSGQIVISPLFLTGQARGSWFFEATAPVYLEDMNGQKIAQGYIQATGDWMTTNLVPFTGTLTWTATSSGTTTAARVVFMNDNPSGLVSLQKAVGVPVVISR